MRSPWNGGSISLRRARCSRPSSSSSEREPMIGCSAIVRPGGSVWPGNGVERADRLGVREHHHRRLEAEEADAERVAEAPPAGLEERDRPQQPAQGLHDRRLGWPWRERAHRRTVAPTSRARPAPIRRAAPHRRPPPSGARLPPPDVAHVLRLQRTIGNRATTRLLRQPSRAGGGGRRRARALRGAKAEHAALASIRRKPHALRARASPPTRAWTTRRRSGSRPRSRRAGRCARTSAASSPRPPITEGFEIDGDEDDSTSRPEVPRATAKP